MALRVARRKAGPLKSPAATPTATAQFFTGKETKHEDAPALTLMIEPSPHRTCAQ